MTNAPWYRRLHWQILLAMAIGTGAGLAGGPALAVRVGWIGTLFLALLKMLIVPLIITSIVSGVASIRGGRDLGRLFGKTLGYYVLTSLLAALVGLVVVQLIRPGDGAVVGMPATSAPLEKAVAGSPIDVLVDIVPANVFRAAAEPDMLSVIFFSIVFGIAVAHLPDQPRRILLDLFDAGFQAMMKLTSGVILFLPLGVFGLMARLVGESGLDSFRALGLFMTTIVLGLSLQLFLVLPLVLILLGRMSPRIHFSNMLEALLMAFSTSSSAATLPVTIKNVEEKAGVSNRISSFVLPMGATVNMDGTALHQCAGVLFIAQAMGVDLSIGAQLLVILTALLASVGAAAVPSAGLIIIFIGLDAVNLRGPEVDLLVGAMLAVDRPLDMYRTVVNVFSDSSGAAIIAKSEGETVNSVAAH